MIGAIIGDIIGSPYEHQKLKLLEGVLAAMWITLQGIGASGAGISFEICPTLSGKSTAIEELQ